MLEIKNKLLWDNYPTYKVLTPQGVEKIVKNFLSALIFPFDTVKEVQNKVKKGSFVRCIYFNDYSQTTLIERAIIEYCEKYESKNIVVFNTQYNGKCAFIFSDSLDDLDDLFYYGADEFYEELKGQMIDEEINALVKEGKIKDLPEVRNFVDTYFFECAYFEPQRIEYSEKDLIESLNKYFAAYTNFPI